MDKNCVRLRYNGLQDQMVLKHILKAKVPPPEPCIRF